MGYHTPSRLKKSILYTSNFKLRFNHPLNDFKEIMSSTSLLRAALVSFPFFKKKMVFHVKVYYFRGVMISVPALFIVKTPPQRPLIEDFDSQTGLKRFSVLPFFSFLNHSFFLVPRDSYIKLKADLNRKNIPFFSIVRLRFLIPTLSFLFLVTLRLRLFFQVFIGGLTNKREILRSEICRLGKSNLKVFLHKFSVHEDSVIEIGGRPLEVKNINFKDFSEEGKICVFAHFDINANLHDYVLDYLKALNEKGYQVIFVTCSLNEDLASQVGPYVSKFVRRENVGHDFLSFMVGLFLYRKDIMGKELLIANDSVFVDTERLKTLLNSLEGKSFEVYGASKSIQYSEHLQSYFLAFGKAVTSDYAFWQFWETYPAPLVKDFIVLHGEIGLSKHLVKRGYKLGAYSEDVNFKATESENPVYDRGVELVEKHEFPFLKKQLVLRYYNRQNSCLRKYIDTESSSKNLRREIRSYFSKTGIPV